MATSKNVPVNKASEDSFPLTVTMNLLKIDLRDLIKEASLYPEFISLVKKAQVLLDAIEIEDRVI